jgi:hypothetical protein
MRASSARGVSRNSENAYFNHGLLGVLRQSWTRSRGENEDERAAGLSPSGSMLKEERLHSLTLALADLDIVG